MSKTTQNLSQVLISVKKVMADWRYSILTLVAALALFLFSIWLPNLSFVREITFSSFFTITQKISILLSSLGAFQTNLRPFGRVALVIASLLFGLNVSLFSFYLKQRVKLEKEAGVGLGGIILGILGVGCASCGSFILTLIFGASASIAFLGLLPLKGQEFAILGILLLGLSIVLITKKIQEPLVCK